MGRRVELNVREMLERVVPENGRISGLSAWAGKKVLVILEDEPEAPDLAPKKKGA